MKNQALQLARVIWKGLRRIVERIGRWTIRTIVRQGSIFLVGYLGERVEVFKARLKRVLRRKRHAKWRPAFLRGRIRRYQVAMRWLQRNWSEAARVTEDNIAPRIEDLPEDSPWENPRAWRRMVNA